MPWRDESTDNKISLNAYLQKHVVNNIASKEMNDILKKLSDSISRIDPKVESEIWGRANVYDPHAMQQEMDAKGKGKGKGGVSPSRQKKMGECLEEFSIDEHIQKIMTSTSLCHTYERDVKGQLISSPPRSPK